MSRKLPVILCAAYLALVALATIPVFAGDDALSGIFAVMLAMPWAALIGKVVPGATDGLIGGLVLVGVGAAINAVLIFVITRWFTGRLAGRK